MGDRRPSWSCQTARPAPQYSPQPHEAAWYRAFFVTAPPRNIAATNLQLAAPTSVRGFSERYLKLVFLQSLPKQSHSLSSCAVVCGISLARAKESSEETSPVLRISVTSDSDVSIHFQLEGKLIGPWVEELRQLSNTALLGNKAVTLDLKKLWFTDLPGAGLLRDLQQRQVSQINCSQFITQQLLAVDQPTIEGEGATITKT